MQMTNDKKQSGVSHSLFHPSLLPFLLHPHQELARSHRLRTFGKWLTGYLAFWINLDNRGSSNDVRVAEVGAVDAQQGVRLSLGAGGDGVDFVILASRGDCHLDGGLLETGEEDGVDGGGGCDVGVECFGVGESVGECDGGAIGSVVGKVSRQQKRKGIRWVVL